MNHEPLNTMRFFFFHSRETDPGIFQTWAGTLLQNLKEKHHFDKDLVPKIKEKRHFVRELVPKLTKNNRLTRTLFRNLRKTTFERDLAHKPKEKRAFDQNLGPKPSGICSFHASAIHPSCVV